MPRSSFASRIGQGTIATVLGAFVLAGCTTESATDALPPVAQPAAPLEGPTAAPAPTEARGEAAASPAPDDGITLEAVDVAGYRKALERHRGKVVFVDFWATWCTPCMESFPHTVHLSRAFPQDQVAVVSVSFDDPESKDAALAFLRKQEARFDNLLSAYGAGVESMEAFDIDGGVPHYKIYDRQGNLAKTLIPGPELHITLELLEREVRAALDAN